MVNFLKPISAFLFVFFLLSCGGGYAAKTQPVPDLASQKNTEKLNETIMHQAAGQSGAIEGSYLIGPEDRLEIDAYHVEELKKIVRVNSLGDIALPLVGILNVKGLTTSEVEQLI